ncbi:twin-arginine translocation signal domain-containing protein [Coralloluteibacterium thermophilus]|uniref:Twin-arginine translocation signal domain-containing protein n=1 Tax=Coralloluteibacterium thermophilum TaxID=2707049 RepID=A0ABV9NMI6_9GAMM
MASPASRVPIAWIVAMNRAPLRPAPTDHRRSCMRSRPSGANVEEQRLLSRRQFVQGLAAGGGGAGPGAVAEAKLGTTLSGPARSSRRHAV